MTALTLPGTIPDLLRRGSPGFRLALGDASRQEAILVHATADRPQLYCGDGSELCAEIRSGPLVWWPVRSLALDLTDPTGRAHAAWWLAAASNLVTPWAARWCGGASIWTIECPVQDAQWVVAFTTTWSKWHGHRIAALDALNPHDPRLLPDGSRRVDAEALRLVCLHVAGVPS